jgi:hypothetical protein
MLLVLGAAITAMLLSRWKERQLHYVLYQVTVDARQSHSHS